MEQLAFGDRVEVEWGLDGVVAAIVQEIYGPPGRRHVLVLLTPEVSGSVVSEPVTFSVPLDSVRRTDAA